VVASTGGRYLQVVAKAGLTVVAILDLYDGINVFRLKSTAHAVFVLQGWISIGRGRDTEAT
jgi:hypothetical protein